MSFIPTVIRATYRSDYQIELVFNDGLVATVDFARWLDGPIFEPSRNPEYVRRFFVAGGTLPWPNGAARAPVTPYEEAAAGRPAPPTTRPNILGSAAKSNSKTNPCDLVTGPQTTRDAGPAPAAPGREHEEVPTQRRHGVPQALHRVSSKMDEMRRRRARQR